jgi:hypothetical protein
VLHGPASERLGGQLRGERGRLARALEADLAGGGHEITAPVGSVIDTIVLLNDALEMCACPWDDVLDAPSAADLLRGMPHGCDAYQVA